MPVAVDETTITELLTMAQRTASWCNIQPWEVVVVSGDSIHALRARMLDEHDRGVGSGYDIPPPAEYQGVHRERRRQSGIALYAKLGIAKEDVVARANYARRNYEFFGAPHLAVVSCDSSLGPYALVDVGGYIANFMLAATSLGIATVAQGAIARHAGLIRQVLDIPSDRRIVAGIAFGYEDLDHPANGFRTSRAPVESAVRLHSSGGTPSASSTSTSSAPSPQASWRRPR